MSRLYEASTEGQWLSMPCPRCGGDNQRQLHVVGETRPRWWWSDASDAVCGLCRCDIEADEQEHDQQEER